MHCAHVFVAPCRMDASVSPLQSALAGRNKFNIAIKQAWCTFQYWLSQYCSAHVFCIRAAGAAGVTRKQAYACESEWVCEQHNWPRRCGAGGDNDEDTHTLILSLLGKCRKSVCVFSERASLSSLFTPAPRSADSGALLCAGEIEFGGERRTARVQTLWKLASAAQNMPGWEMAALQNETRGLTRHRLSLSLGTQRPVFDANGITRLYSIKTEGRDAGKGGF